MNRYLFWILMVLPWIALTMYLKSSAETEITTAIFIMLFLYLITVVEIRRRTVKISVIDTLKAQIPFWGWEERKRLYFTKP
ncbi:hypothetical protein ABID22_000758 [Pontibacter aydingkolensis]|uniref:Uncharacterized protein n=1 Tax=Pontibacter aydingkolensis TaxID=1911536 RepID=A0ABS7CR92_9BACT|nr:hypothetical protein [Pontibacter aydingkolensis]MBW7466371.1 hypothetical protein [Pontibacter aydingkolensis]